MIVKDILDKPELIDRFDFANDFQETWRWLFTIKKKQAIERRTDLLRAFQNHVRAKQKELS